jgi:hypothetical protein
VAARKKRPVLYEVYRPSAKTSDPARKPRFTRLPAEKERPSPSHEPELRAPATPMAPPKPAAANAGGTWQMTVSASTLAIVVAGMVVLLAVAFSAGRKYEAHYPSSPDVAELTQGGDDEGGEATLGGSETAGESEAEQPIQTARKATTRSEPPAESKEGDKPQPGSAKPPQVALQIGHHYVVVQHFKRRNPQAALDAARFLKDNGVPCATLTGADIRVIATEPFRIRQGDAAASRAERRRADELMRKIRGLGKEYSKLLAKRGKKGYTFSDCYLYEVK